MPGQRQPGAPVLRVARHQPTAGFDESLRGAEPLRGLLQTIERKIRAVWRDVDDPFPRLKRAGPVARTRLDVAKIEVGRCRVLVPVDRGLEPFRRAAGVALAQRFFAELVFEKGEDGLIARR